MLVAFASVAVVVALGAAAALARHRRAAARGPAISLPGASRSAGASHLAARVSELSDLGLHLRAGPPRRSLGTLLGSGHAASR